MRVISLNHAKQYQPAVADLLVQQWADIYRQLGMSDADVHAMIESRCTDTVPFFLIALDEQERLLGCGAVKDSELFTDANLEPWLAAIVVTPEGRGRGVGSKIVRACEQRAAQHGIRTLYLSTDQAEAFYQKLGWERIDYRQSLGVEVALMKRELSSLVAQ
ncbi:hypothetical protein CWI84_02840 [Idiomarina tyrosinivorans]|uniref:N-acetyltransferase domain-containing protein n=1 Tax=Idiomarina tyrosinivorans TaxID=1445662 RepID=A0A432ZT03_9GAMM|nr:GNAT family N-acetyltransferase [Idiomarina tyrosinivorans]RUO81064.1 hypothetical protein CWI84_02840 [Idiomarina tyrosinivorans]